MRERSVSRRGGRRKASGETHSSYGKQLPQQLILLHLDVAASTSEPEVWRPATTRRRTRPPAMAGAGQAGGRERREVGRRRTRWRGRRRWNTARAARPHGGAQIGPKNDSEASEHETRSSSPGNAPPPRNTRGGRGARGRKSERGSREGRGGTSPSRALAGPFTRSSRGAAVGMHQTHAIACEGTRKTTRSGEPASRATP